MYLIRHARPVLSGVMLGSTDSPLAEETITPCRLEVDRVWTSPLQRARRTAELLFPGREVVVAAELAERGLGEWEGLAWGEVKSRWPEEAARAMDDWFGFTPRGGEPWPEFVGRVRQVWKRAPRGGATAIVAHAGVNAVLHALATGADVSGFQQEYGEVIQVELSD